jgi:hypothetical protein
MPFLVSSILTYEYMSDASGFSQVTAVFIPISKMFGHLIQSQVYK